MRGASASVLPKTTALLPGSTPRPQEVSPTKVVPVVTRPGPRSTLAMPLCAVGGIEFPGGVEAHDRDVGIAGGVAAALRVALGRARDEDLAVALDGDGPRELAGLAAHGDVGGGDAVGAEGRVQLALGVDAGDRHGLIAVERGVAGRVDLAIGGGGHGHEAVVGARAQREGGEAVRPERGVERERLRS